MTRLGPDWLLLTHLAATWFMVGLIWLVQIVHYPLMAEVPPDRFAAFARQHQYRITWIVLPIMSIELVSAFVLLGYALFQPVGLSAQLATAVGLVLVLLIWGMTLGVHVPQHRRLAAGFDPTVHRTLVRSNWVRTVAWTLRGGVALYLLPG